MQTNSLPSDVAARTALHRVHVCIQAVLQPPQRASKALSSRALAAVANRMLTAVLATSTRPFLDGLARDYEDWALGRERKAETIDAQSMNAMLRKSVPGSELIH